MKKTVVWLCDVEGWAYDGRATQLIAQLKDYDHKKIYVVGRKPGIVEAAIKEADIIVCMYVQYMELLRKFNNVVTLIGGMRPFENRT